MSLELSSMGIVSSKIVLEIIESFSHRIHASLKRELLKLKKKMHLVFCLKPLVSLLSSLWSLFNDYLHYFRYFSYISI
jgi:hypothetical protein